ncbi:hypothetical protein E2R51_08660 [Jeotgalibacillus sp. S-D1]|uniref:hypothetical protein n=1 Tax=Jeotgalibacillus sp. S-D1 TaxID=2552189 RepID=UPI0010596A4E|nr:hypothetical protein [Jeotgalibacillus sp. S-D1]TDL32736.1 hypothetical protein E2R51_08660 [Jeotgalibacillus sp. S-D1]
MDVLGISVLILLLLIGLSLVLDLMVGLHFRTSVIHVFNPFLVMEVPELIIFFFLMIAPFVYWFIKKIRKSRGQG